MNGWLDQCESSLKGVLDFAASDTFDTGAVKKFYDDYGSKFTDDYDQFLQDYFTNISGNGIYSINWDQMAYQAGGVNSELVQQAYSDYLAMFGMQDSPEMQEIFDHYWILKYRPHESNRPKLLNQLRKIFHYLLIAYKILLIQKMHQV